MSGISGSMIPDDVLAAIADVLIKMPKASYSDQLSVVMRAINGKANPGEVLKILKGAGK